MKLSKFSRLTVSKLAFSIGLIVTAQVQAQTEIEEIEVTGTRAALQNAMQRQRDSDQIIGVVDSDALGNFGDINVSESLRRISGIMVENDQGEGRYVTVRGMNTDLNAMTINGVSMASPEDRRGVMLDGVPTDMLDSMTVYKTLTPELDADTIGGAIDLETITAFKYDGMHLRLKAETSYNELTEDADNPALSATFTNRFTMEDGELGLAIVLSDQSRRIVAQNNEAGGWGAIAPNDDYEMRFYDLTRERQGVVFNLDYMANSGTTYYAHLFHNIYDDTEYRGKWETRDIFEDYVPVVTGSGFTYPASRMDSEGRYRIESREVTALQIGASFELNNGIDVELELFGSMAEQDDRDRFTTIFRSDEINTPLSFGGDPRQPVLTFAPYFYDPANFEANAWEVEPNLTEDQDFGGRFDISQNFSDNTEIKYGAKVRLREKSNDSNFCGYEPVADSTLADYGVKNIPAYLNNVHGPAPDENTITGIRNMLGSGFTTLSDGTAPCQASGANFDLSGDEEEESIPADWTTTEDIYAAYLMATTRSDKTTMIYGLRYEHTEATYQGKSWEDTFLGTVSYDNNYGFLAPSFNLRHELSEQQVARFGIFRSLVRPGFTESRAGAILDLGDNEIEGGNPDLDPTTAWNFDLGYELYLNQETYFSAGVFYKKIDDAIVEVESDDLFMRGQTWDRAQTYLNADDSSIAGFELSLQTAMDNGLVLVLNYTYADGETDLPAGSVSGQRTIPYFKQAEDTANFVIGYDKNAWDIRLATNYRSSYIDALGDDTSNDRYTSDHFQVDLTARYQINDRMQLNVAAINLNDRPEYYYFGNNTRLSQYDEYGTTYTLGMRYVF
tara:strand:- start:164864 stop:167392 length:2529 start_codon:yes stop_codon:yes gene_type:complete